jgi:hypothetical protein
MSEQAAPMEGRTLCRAAQMTGHYAGLEDDRTLCRAGEMSGRAALT